MKKSINVCIVDDDDIYQYTMSLNLKKIDSVGQIRIFNDGAEAIEFITEKLDDQKELPDILFLDINMPVMDGYQFMEEYVKLIPQIKKKIMIYIVSSSVDPIDLEKSKKLSTVSDYIVKPIVKKQLQELLEEL